MNILSWLFNMSTGEEEEHGYEAIIKALMKALTDIKGSLTDSLKPPTFDWHSPEQFEDFPLFIKGMESWYMLQGIPDKAGDTTRLEYLLNFLGPIGQRKHEQWNPSGAAAEEWEKNKKSAMLFMEFLHSSMDHLVSQWCRIYQLEEIRIKAGETPDKLIERIRGLADRCNFPTDVEKERHIQFQMVHALSDRPDQETLGDEDQSNYCWNAGCVLHTHRNHRQHVFNGPINKSHKCSTENNKEAIITQQPLWQLYKMSHPRERALPSKGLYLPFLPEDRSLEAEMQEV